MNTLIVKTWIEGDFKEVGRFNISEVKQIRHHTDGLQLVFKGNIKLYNTQSIIEFE